MSKPFFGRYEFTDEGIFWWLVSIVAWVITFNNQAITMTSLQVSLANAVQGLQNFFRKPLKVKWSWTLVALIVILLVGAYFRFGNLNAYPPDIVALRDGLDGFLQREVIARHERHAALLDDERRLYTDDGRYHPDALALIRIQRPMPNQESVIAPGHRRLVLLQRAAPWSETPTTPATWLHRNGPPKCDPNLNGGRFRMILCESGTARRVCRAVPTMG